MCKSLVSLVSYTSPLNVIIPCTFICSSFLYSSYDNWFTNTILFLAKYKSISVSVSK